MNLVIALLALVGLWMLVVWVHECGHAVAGWLNGMRCHLLVIGPFSLRREGDRLRPHWNRSALLAGGAVLMLPADDHDLKRRAAWMVAGGPLASLALAVAGCGVYEVMGHAPVWRVCGFIGLLSAGIFLATAIPSHWGLPSDGSRLLTLWRGGPKAEKWCALLTTGGAVKSFQPTGSSTFK